MTRSAEAAVRLGVKRQFLHDLEREFPRRFSTLSGSLYGPNGGLVYGEELFQAMQILASVGITGMAAVRIAAAGKIEDGRIVIG